VTVLFWILAGLVAYAYVGYAALLWLAVRVTGRRPRAVLPGEPSRLPRVTVVLPAHNEADWLRRRLENLLALRYPRDRLEIVVGSDGSTDATAEIARSFGERGVRVVDAPARRGKTAILNEMVGVSSGDAVVFTDANACFGEDALQHLVGPFVSPAVGCVVGELVYVNGHDPAVRAGEGLYWRLESAIKEMEGRFGGTLVATGAIYALRRELCRTLPGGISDDALNPLLALAAGYEVVVEPRARVFEKAATSLREEFHRKARMVTRQLGAHAHVRFFLVPLRPVLAFRLASHKLLRWLAPVFALGALLIGVIGLEGWVRHVTLAVALVGLAAFAAGAAAIGRGVTVPAAVRLWVYFCVVNAAALTGIADFLRGRERATWPASASTR
jgi:cellulose synthase/poly-beta-1,6-N-acetylglucosamine synthase-like glycosyltransferase